MRTKLALIAATVAAISCVTINVYFPEAAIKDLSQQIEEQVRKEAAKREAEAAKTPTPAPQEDAKKPGPSAGLLDSLLGALPAFAEDVAAPEVTSPAIRKIIDSRAARASALADYKSKGVVGENNQARVEVRNLETLPDLKARAEVQRLVRAENADREELFKEIAAAKKVDLSQLPKIRETYARTLRDGARPGEWVQMPDGTWSQK